MKTIRRITSSRFDLFWSMARSFAHRAPESMSRMIMDPGIKEITVHEDQIDEIVDWAESVCGWNGEGTAWEPHPLEIEEM